jgi:hypothetical protein
LPELFFKAPAVPSLRTAGFGFQVAGMGTTRKSLLFYLFLVVSVCGLGAQEKTWQPAPGHTQIPLWPGAVPDPQPDTGPEVLMISKEKHYVAGRPVTMLGSVSKPTMTVYPAKGKNTGAAVVVFPGGGYEDLAMDLEGTEVCT